MCMVVASGLRVSGAGVSLAIIARRASSTSRGSPPSRSGLAAYTCTIDVNEQTTSSPTATTDLGQMTDPANHVVTCTHQQRLYSARATYNGSRPAGIAHTVDMQHAAVLHCCLQSVPRLVRPHQHDVEVCNKVDIRRATSTPGTGSSTPTVGQLVWVCREKHLLQALRADRWLHHHMALWKMRSMRG